MQTNATNTFLHDWGASPRAAGGTASISVYESLPEHSPTWALSIQLTTRIGLQGDVNFLGR